MSKRKLVHIFVVTDDVDALVPFYRDVLGLKLERAKPGHSAWFDTGEVNLVIHGPESVREALDLLPSDSPTVVWLQPAEGVSNVDHGLVRQGIDVLRPSNADNYLFVRDPEGRVIGFHEPARESR